MSIRELLPSGVRFSGPLIVSVLAVATVTVFISEDLWLMSRGLLTSTATESRSGFNDALLKHDELAETSGKRFTGRSVFTIPPAPIRAAPPAAVVTRNSEPPTPPPPPPIPAEYSGPLPTGFFGNKVIFATGGTIAVSQASGGVRVIGIEPPYSVRLGFGGGEYSVAIWTKTDLAKLAETSLKNSVDGIKAVLNPQANGDPTTGRAATGAPVVPPSPQVSQPAGSSGSGTAPVLTHEQINGMSRRDAQMALAAVIRAQKAPEIDDATKTRLSQEFDWLVERVRNAS
ncbi:MAG: hypothetical protein EXS00_09360 [Phycisphaerales bacterium]|nr:hypothetical protein [Phycisphaerales bacterium]